MHIQIFVPDTKIMCNEMIGNQIQLHRQDHVEGMIQ